MTAVQRPPTRGEIRRGAARDAVPLILGVLPFGLVIGATIAEADVDGLAAWLGAPLIFAGMAQLTVVQLLDEGAALPIVVLTALLVNARFLLYSARMASWFGAEPVGRRVWFSVFTVDQSFLVAERRFAVGDLDQSGRRSYFVTLGVTLMSAWVSIQTVGVLIGDSIPTGVGLELAAPLVFAGLLALSLKDASTTLVTVVAGAVGLATIGVPFHAAVPLGTLAGLVVGGMTTTTEDAG